MSFGMYRVRIELCDVMTLSTDDGDVNMTVRQGADIWLSDGNGKIQRARKPAITLVDETRAGVLRQIADWIESKEDPGLNVMAKELAHARKASGTTDTTEENES